MKKCMTALTKEQVSEILENGFTVYAFLQEAAFEKLEKINSSEKALDNENRTTEILIELIQSVSENLKKITNGIEDVDEKISRTNDIAVNRLKMIVDVLKEIKNDRN